MIDHDYLSAGDNPHASGDVAWQGCTVPGCGRPRSEHRNGKPREPTAGELARARMAGGGGGGVGVVVHINGPLHNSPVNVGPGAQVVTYGANRTQPPGHVIEVCRARAAASPCGKSQRGAAVFNPVTGAVFGHACNHLPGGIDCALALSIADRDCSNPRATFGDGEACRKACGVRCVHAEAAAILSTATAYRAGLTGLEIVHLKASAGVQVPSGEPSCVPCAALILEVGLDACWLLHAEGWRRYAAADFYRRSCAAKGLPER